MLRKYFANHHHAKFEIDFNCRKALLKKAYKHKYRCKLTIMNMFKSKKQEWELL